MTQSKLSPTISQLLLHIAEQHLTTHKNSINLNFTDKYIQAIYLIDNLKLYPIICTYEDDKQTPKEFNLISPQAAYDKLDREDYCYIPSKHCWVKITEPTQLELPIKTSN